MTQPTCDSNSYDSADVSLVADVNVDANVGLNTSLVDVCLGADLDVSIGIGVDLGLGDCSPCA